MYNRAPNASSQVWLPGRALVVQSMEKRKEYDPEGEAVWLRGMTERIWDSLASTPFSGSMRETYYS